MHYLTKLYLNEFLHFVILLALVETAIAQEMPYLRVSRDPERLENEIVAKKVVGDNDSLYYDLAGIMIVSDIDSLDFRSDPDKNIVKRDSFPGKDVLYLTPSCRTVRVYKSGFKPVEINLADIGIKLQSSKIWLLEIAGFTVIKQIAINITTQPEGAKIYLDNKDIGIVEALVTSQGRHQIMIEKDGYETIVEEIEVDEDHTAFSYPLQKLIPKSLTITKIPFCEVSFGYGVDVRSLNLNANHLGTGFLVVDGQISFNTKKILKISALLIDLNGKFTIGMFDQYDESRGDVSTGYTYTARNVGVGLTKKFREQNHSPYIRLHYVRNWLFFELDRPFNPDNFREDFIGIDAELSTSGFSFGGGVEFSIINKNWWLGLNLAYNLLSPVRMIKRDQIVEKLSESINPSYFYIQVYLTAVVPIQFYR